MTVAEQFTTVVSPIFGAALRRIVWSSVHRHRRRVVRLPDLRHRDRAGVQQAVLPDRRPRRSSTIVAFGTYGSASSRVRWAPRSSAISATGSAARRCWRSTIVIMGVGTFLIGLLPTYRADRHRGAGAAGVALPAGHRPGGEWGGAVLMVVENAPTRRRGLLGSMVQIGNPDRQSGGDRHVRAGLELPEADFLCLGLADSVPGQRAAGRRRPVHPAAPGRNAGVPRAASARNALARGCRSSRCSRTTAGRS